VFLVFAGQSFSGRPARKVFGTLGITVAFDEIARCGGIEASIFCDSLTALDLRKALTPKVKATYTNA
jgi:hypothetical protein